MPRRQYSEAVFKRKRLQLQLNTDRIKFRQLKIADEAEHCGNFEVDLLVARANRLLKKVDEDLADTTPANTTPTYTMPNVASPY